MMPREGHAAMSGEVSRLPRNAEALFGDAPALGVCRRANGEEKRHGQIWVDGLLPYALSSHACDVSVEFRVPTNIEVK